jgi:hypothetical protein
MEDFFNTKWFPSSQSILDIIKNMSITASIPKQRQYEPLRMLLEYPFIMFILDVGHLHNSNFEDNDIRYIKLKLRPYVRQYIMSKIWLRVEALHLSNIVEQQVMTLYEKIMDH